MNTTTTIEKASQNNKFNRTANVITENGTGSSSTKVNGDVKSSSLKDLISQ